MPTTRPTTRFRRVQQAGAVVPLALLSVAATASLTAGPAAPPTVSASPTTPGGSGAADEPVGVPAEALEAPASLSRPEGASGTPGSGFEGEAREIVATSSTNGIPSAALAAYQRAEQVINQADPGCRLSWQLVAAIGRVESDHGRFGGSALDDDGVATPAILGLPLDGTNGTRQISDTDAGELDGDRRFDRAVGPMQFIPSTWAVVGVDADDDGVRDPQDVDDASLATAVYLCSGQDDLSTLTGQRAAVFRYNNSESYVDLVLSIMDAYLEGDFTSVPDGTTAAGVLTPTRPTTTPDRPDAQPTPDRPSELGSDGGGTPEIDPTPEPSPEPAPAPEPNPGGDGGDNGGNNGGNNGGGDGGSSNNNGGGNDGGGNDGGGNDGGGNDGGNDGGGGGPVQVPDVPDTGIPPVDDTITRAEALLQCTLDGVINLPLTGVDELQVCVEDLLATNP